MYFNPKIVQYMYYTNKKMSQKFYFYLIFIHLKWKSKLHCCCECLHLCHLIFLSPSLTSLIVVHISLRQNSFTPFILGGERKSFGVVSSHPPLALWKEATPAEHSKWKCVKIGATWVALLHSVHHTHSEGSSGRLRFREQQLTYLVLPFIIMSPALQKYLT